ncbi:MAG TPA: type III-B CRISPR module-associated protein Cmr3 [Bacillota bacterium]|nr:type III-B CRISPR module-associated protein Cmr3 [Bacillota bacterium]
MNVWLIEPRDPLIARDGRPFGPVPGARAFTLAFPFPSTIAGAVRTRDGLDASGRFQTTEIPRLKQIEVLGPLLVELDAGTGDIDRLLVPAPADALFFEIVPSDFTKAAIRQLVPLRKLPGSYTNLPKDTLAPVGMSRRDPRKPHGKTPAFWYWKFFEKWLVDPCDGDVQLVEVGHNGPVQEVRMHASIRPDTQTADEEKGALFQTRGLEFACPAGENADGGVLSSLRRMGLAVATDAPNLKVGIAPMGGERRPVFWRQSKQALPACPEDIKEKIATLGYCRLILLTPAHFGEGWKPSRLLENREGVQPYLLAAALKRHQTVSGWDFHKGKRKPTRRLAPAGTVYFLKLNGDSASIKRWVDSIWLSCVSDGEQDRRDGFGLAVAGVWDGKLHQMEV